MATLDQARTLGGIGSILMLLTVVPLAGAILGIIGFILVLIALKYISEIVGDESIFKNYLIAMIVGIVGLIITVFMGFGSIMTSFQLMGGAGPGPGSVFHMLPLVIGVLAVAWIISIISAFFIRKSFNAVASALNVGMFSTAALLYLIGAFLVIVFIGAIVIFIAEILQIVAFFQIPVQKQ